MRSIWFIASYLAQEKYQSIIWCLIYLPLRLWPFSQNLTSTTTILQVGLNLLPSSFHKCLPGCYWLMKSLKIERKILRWPIQIDNHTPWILLLDLFNRNRNELKRYITQSHPSFSVGNLHLFSHILGNICAGLVNILEEGLGKLYIIVILNRTQQWMRLLRFAWIPGRINIFHVYIALGCNPPLILLYSQGVQHILHILKLLYRFWAFRNYVVDYIHYLLVFLVY